MAQAFIPGGDEGGQAKGGKGKPPLLFMGGPMLHVQDEVRPRGGQGRQGQGRGLHTLTAKRDLYMPLSSYTPHTLTPHLCIIINIIINIIIIIIINPSCTHVYTPHTPPMHHHHHHQPPTLIIICFCQWLYNGTVYNYINY